MAFLTLYQILSFALQLLLAILSIWSAILIFRSRNMAGWIALSGAVVYVLFLATAYLLPVFVSRLPSFRGMNEWIWSLYLAGGVGQLVFLGGVLLHLQKKNAEAARIAELEAIIRDRDI